MQNTQHRSGTEAHESITKNILLHEQHTMQSPFGQSRDYSPNLNFARRSFRVANHFIQVDEYEKVNKRVGYKEQNFSNRKRQESHSFQHLIRLLQFFILNIFIFSFPYLPGTAWLAPLVHYRSIMDQSTVAEEHKCVKIK